MQNYNSKSKTFYFILSFLIFAFWILSFNAAEAALVIQAPKYIGLTSGLVGYWSFDPVRKKRILSLLRNWLCAKKYFMFTAFIGWLLSNGVDGKDMVGNMENLNNKM